MITPGESEEICVLCCREIRIFATGECDHPVCYECSTRMRVLCEQRECPICRRDMPVVLFTKFKQVFTTLTKNSPFVEKKYRVVFENREIQKEYEHLLENKCEFCRSSFRTFQQLRDHVRREHERYYCELCVNSLKIFPFERKCYTRKEIAFHRRVGDPDNTSHRGHPLCEFCDIRYVDTDELYRHLRREHFFCHFCDADGKNHYYKDHKSLKTHFRSEHFLCEDGDCSNETFTGAFRTSIDLQAHKALHHTKNKSKAEVKQARTLELEFTIAPRSSQNGYGSQYGDSRYLRHNRHNQHRKRNIEDNSGRAYNSSPHCNQLMQGSSQQTFNMKSEQEFPHLSGEGISNSENSIAEVQKPQENQCNTLTVHSYGRLSGASKAGSVMRNEDFPALPSTMVSINSLQSVGSSRYATPTLQESPDGLCQSFHVSFDASKMKPHANKTAFIQEVEAHVSPNSGISIQCSSKSSTNHSNLKGKKPISTRPFLTEGPDESDSKQRENPPWAPVKKITSFEEDFPALNPKTSDTLPVESKALNAYLDAVTATVPKEGNASFSHQITIKCKSKKKKQKKSPAEKESKTLSISSEPVSKKEPFHISAIFSSSASHTQLENQENEDPSVCSSVATNNIASHLSVDKRKSITEEPKLKHSVNLEDEFPPLPAPPAKQKVPPGFSVASVPPPGFPAKSSTEQPPSSINISLSSVAKQLTSGENGHFRTVQKSNELYKNNVLFHMYQQPENFHKRNTELTKLVHQLVGANSNLFNSFKHLASQYRQNFISADEYHKKCLDVLGRDGFLQIIDELIALLPDITKQKELLTIHQNYVDNESKTHGAIPKWNHSNRLSSSITQLIVCAVCQQVLVKSDYESHQTSHDSEFCMLKT